MRLHSSQPSSGAYTPPVVARTAMKGGRVHHSSARQVVCRLCDTPLAADLLPLHSHYCTTAQHALLTQPLQLQRRFIDEYCDALALDLSARCKRLADEQRRQRESEVERREESKAQLIDEEEAEDAMLDVCGRMEQVTRDTASTHSWLALQHIFHSLKAVCRRGFAVEWISADRQQLSDDLLLLARLCAAAIKQKMRAVVSSSRPSSSGSDTSPLPRRHSASAVHSDPSTPHRVAGLRGVSSPVSAPITHSSAASAAYPSSVPSSRSSRFNPSSRAQLSASTTSTPAASRAASPALVLSFAPSLTHSISSPADSTHVALTPPAAMDSPLSHPVADYQQLSYELGRKALLHTYMRRSSSKGSRAKKASGRIGGSSTPSPPRVAHSLPPSSPSPVDERKESESERVKEEAVDSLRPTSMKDFHFIRCLSVGGSSRVWLCEKRSTGDKYAVKVMRKHELLHRNNAHRAMLERHILSLSSHPYIVPLYYAIPSRHHLYLVLEYMRGGDLADLLHSSPSSMSRAFIRSVLAEVLLSLEYLHELGFVHRDVKPENIMLDGTGHVKLTDFGLSKHWLHTGDHTATAARHSDATSSPAVEYKHKNDSSASDSDSSNSPQNCSLLPSASRFSAVGTHNYLAPETILGLPATPAVDWWALGVLGFHLLVGQPPFAAETVEAVMDNIVRGRVRWGDRREERLGEQATDLVRRLLIVDAKQRLGSGGADEIKKHALFAGVDWDALMQQKGDRIDSNGASVTGVTESAVFVSAAVSSATDAQPSSAAARELVVPQPMDVTLSHLINFSHTPSSRARHSSATSPAVSAPVSPLGPALQTPPVSQLPACGDGTTSCQPPPQLSSSPSPSRPHLLTSLPAYTASSEFDHYAALSDTPSPSSPAKLASPSLPSYLTSLAPVTTDLSLSALSSFPSLSQASSSLLSSLSLSSSAFLLSASAAASTAVSSANQSSLDRLLSLTKPSPVTAKSPFDTSVVSRPLSALEVRDEPLGDLAELTAQQEGGLVEQLPMRRSKSRDRSHAVKARRKISASAKIASRTLRSAYCTTPARPMRLSPPASFRASYRSPPAAAPTRRSRESLDSDSLSSLSVVAVAEWSSDADNADADSDLDRVSEMRREALQARKRKDLSRTSPTVQQREQRHYARKSPAAAARRVGSTTPADSASAAAAHTLGPLSSDDSDPRTAPLTVGSASGGVGGVRAVLADVVLSEYVAADMRSSPSTPPVPDWLLPAGDESSEWSEFCSDFSERSADRLAGSASEGGGSGGSSSGSRERDGAAVRGAASGESGVWSSEFASDWSVGSEDELFDGFEWKNLATLQAKNQQVYQLQMSASTRQ